MSTTKSEEWSNEKPEYLNAPDCNVKNNIKQGKIFESRYNTYLDMLKDQNIYRKSDEVSNTES